MKVTVLLADSGQTDSTGKTHALGLGWSIIDGPTTQPIAVIVLANFDGHDQLTGPHDIVLRLVAEDGSPVNIPGTSDPLIVKAILNLGDRPDDVGPSAPVVGSFALNIGPGLPVEPGRLYRWEVEVDNRPEMRADVSFMTRDQAVDDALAAPSLAVS